MSPAMSLAIRAPLLRVAVAQLCRNRRAAELSLAQTRIASAAPRARGPMTDGEQTSKQWEPFTTQSIQANSTSQVQANEIRRATGGSHVYPHRRGDRRSFSLGGQCLCPKRQANRSADCTYRLYRRSDRHCGRATGVEKKQEQRRPRIRRRYGARPQGGERQSAGAGEEA